MPESGIHQDLDFDDFHLDQHQYRRSQVTKMRPDRFIFTAREMPEKPSKTTVSRSLVLVLDSLPLLARRL
jgi:hypothetical protein